MSTTAAAGRFSRRFVAFLSCAAIALAGGAAAIVHAQAGVGGGTAVYWMTADTASGMGAMAGAGGRGMGMGAIMGMGRSQSSYSHNLRLELGGPRKAAGEPSAEHLPPAGLQAGPSLPLVTPRSAPHTDTPWKMEKPKGRMLIYWGCGDRVRAGQPVVVDYESLAAGKMPPAFAAFRGLSGPAPGKNPTYGEWPNARSEVRVPPAGSLVGEHVVRGNYTPEIRFTLAPGQDFMAPVVVSGNEAAPGGGAVPLGWQPVAGAKAWFVSTMGSGRNGDVILWSSSESQAMPMAMGLISPEEIARLVQSKVLLPSSATRCTIPGEIARAAESSVLITTAFGGEANFSHPARPNKAPPSWRPDWTVKLLMKSTYTGILGMDMDAMMSGRSSRDQTDDDEDQPRPRPKKKGPFGGIGGLIGN